MVENLDEYLMGIALGVRFRANFSIEDRLGQIADEILYSDNSFFNPSVFPMVNREAGKKVFFNKNTDDNFQIDNSNIILEINFGKDYTFDKKDIGNIVNHYYSDIIKGVMDQYSIKEVARIGFIKRYIFPIKILADNFVKKTVGQKLGSIEDINLTFSRKLVVEKALTKKDVNDYDNIIFNILKIADKDEIFMSVDFQTYYDPYLPSSSQIEFRKFIEKANKYNNSTFLPWLETNYIGEGNE